MTDTAQGGPTGVPKPTPGGGHSKHSTEGFGPFTQEQQPKQKADKKDDGLPSHGWKQKKD